MYKRFTLNELKTVQNTFISNFYGILKKEHCMMANDLFKKIFKEGKEIYYMNRGDFTFRFQNNNEEYVLMDEREKKTFDFAGDVTKQITTLSIGILTLCIAFTDKLLPSSASSHVWLMFVALFLFTVSILSGILTLLKLTGNLAKNPTTEDQNDSPIYDCGTRLFSICQLSAFSLAIIFSMSFIACSNLP